jgi:hypothetical protein
MGELDATRWSTAKLEATKEAIAARGSTVKIVLRWEAPAATEEQIDAARRQALVRDNLHGANRIGRVKR